MRAYYIAQGKESKKPWVYVWLLHFAAHLKLTQHSKLTVFQKIFFKWVYSYKGKLYNTGNIANILYL